MLSVLLVCISVKPHLGGRTKSMYESIGLYFVCVTAGFALGADIMRRWGCHLRWLCNDECQTGEYV